MPRIARIVAKDFPHHVTQRGARNMRVFFSDRDKYLYKGILLEELKKTSLEVWSYCLMDNHVHFVVVPRQGDDMSKVFGEAHKRYAWLVNHRKGWRGHLWQERFHSFVMDERYLYSAVRYVENNPVKAGIVKRAEDYPWSSAPSRVYSKPDTLLTKSYLDKEIHDWPKFLGSPSGDEEKIIDAIEKHMNGNPLGSENFIEKLESLLKIKLAKKPRGRPAVRNSK